MSDDIVERMRARADAIAENDVAVIEAGWRPNLAYTSANERALRDGADAILALRRQVSEQGEQIERLRAENERFRVEIGALIDTYEEHSETFDYLTLQDFLAFANSPKEDDDG